jgi:hypothetical protein
VSWRRLPFAFPLAELQCGAEQRYVVYSNYAYGAVAGQLVFGKYESIDWAPIRTPVGQLMDGVSCCQSAIHQKCTVTRLTEFHHFTDGSIPMHSTVHDLLRNPSRNSVSC